MSVKKGNLNENIKKGIKKKRIRKRFELVFAIHNNSNDVQNFLVK